MGGGHAEIASWRLVMYTITGFKDSICFLYAKHKYLHCT